MTTYTWNGTDGSYQTAADWSPTGLPGAGDTALINAGNVTIPVGTVFKGGETVLLSGAATLTYQLSNLDFLTGNTFILPANPADTGTAALIDDGILDVDTGTLVISVPVLTTQNAYAAAEVGIGTLEFGSSVAAGMQVSIDGPDTPVDRAEGLTGTGILKLDQPAAFQGILTPNFANGIPVGSGIDLVGVQGDTIAFVPDAGANSGDTSMQVLNGGATVASLNLSNMMVGVSVAPDGAGGTMISSQFAPDYGDLKVPGASSQYTVQVTPDATIVSTADLIAYVTPGAPLTFTDGTLSFSNTAYGSDVFRLYQAALDRAPDSPGALYWNALLANGDSLAQIAAGFLAAPEYQDGAFTNAEFVTQLYNDALGRAPDAPGDTYWEGELSDGQSRADVLANFTMTPEAMQDSAAGIAATGVFFPH